MSTAILYVESSSHCGDDDTNEEFLLVNLESLIILNFVNICAQDALKLSVCVQRVSCRKEIPVFKVALSSLTFPVKLDGEILPVARFCTWPTMILSSNVAVSGLASVCRQIIKVAAVTPEIRSLLGFREACLMACSEASVWTKFCEVDLIKSTKMMLLDGLQSEDKPTVPEDLSRFESHMQQPVRAHNIYKLARVKNDNKLLSSHIPLKYLNLEHKYAEGSFLTLSDILIFSCYQVIFRIVDKSALCSIFPLTLAWYDNLCEEKQFFSIDFTSSQIPVAPLTAPFSIYPLTDQSLYKADSHRSKTTYKKTYTKQVQIASVFPRLPTSIERSRHEDTFISDVSLDWCDIPKDAHPLSFDALPKSRGDRKLHQLENLAKAAIKITQDRSLMIVDFCSGSGHLGILVAVLLKRCHIILVENKERSLERATERIERLGLTNVSVIQSNLDYFVGKFDLGLSLHACGVATDLVMQMCIRNGAHFVCCPCCYGSIANCDYLSYPKSVIFREKGISYEDYLTVCHSADQTHDDQNSKTSQGYFCMDIVDNDRKMEAEELGYEVHLDKLQPQSCTPKNNLLIGIFSSTRMQKM